MDTLNMVAGRRGTSGCGAGREGEDDRMDDRATEA